MKYHRFDSWILLYLGSLQEMFEEVENAIFEVQNLQEILDLQSSQLDHRFQLALYKEKKLSELKCIRGKFRLKINLSCNPIID